MSRICPACGGSEWTKFLKLPNGLILTGDQRIEPGLLSKIICAGCGVVANARPLSDQELRILYGEAYQLNTYGREEHLFFTANGPRPRSEVVFEWLTRYLPAHARSVLEIGCGEGNVLARFAYRDRSLRVVGFEGSRKAAELAHAKGLDVRNELILAPEQVLPELDFVFSYNVLEHIEDIDSFVAVLRRACAAEGRLVFGLPLQDDGSYDLFFAEHVWHFTRGHVVRVLERRGLSVDQVDTSNPIIGGAGVFVCSVSSSGGSTAGTEYFDGARSLQARNRDHWLSVFDRLNTLLAGVTGRLAVYGSSEVLSLFMCHTDLRHRSIATCLDEDPGKIGLLKHGIPVNHPDTLADHPVDAVLLTVNPRYNNQIRAKLAPRGVPVLSLFE